MGKKKEAFNRQMDSLYIHVMECVLMMKLNEPPGYEIHEENLNVSNLRREANLNGLHTTRFQKHDILKNITHGDHEVRLVATRATFKIGQR